MTMRNTDFAVFILTHGRPFTVDTYKALHRSGYSGRIYLIIDNEDKYAPDYYDIYGDKVIMFDKAKVAETTDDGDNSNDRRCVVYARNHSFQIAKDLGITYFMLCDDDYTGFIYRINNKLQYPHTHFIIQHQLDTIFDLLLDYYKSIPALSIAMAQGGDFIGGEGNNFAIRENRRKCMNTFICSTERPFQFFGRINEDVNVYTCLQNRGNLFLTIPYISIQQHNTQMESGGLTDIYLDVGTYVKSFYTVMYQPSSVTVNIIYSRHPRLHHSVSWAETVPCIIREDYRKI